MIKNFNNLTGSNKNIDNIAELGQAEISAYLYSTAKFLK